VEYISVDMSQSGCDSEHITHSYSLGTRQLCVASKHMTECRDLPNKPLKSAAARRYRQSARSLRERDDQVASMMVLARVL
jgi:hypothetical protein